MDDLSLLKAMVDGETPEARSDAMVELTRRSHRGNLHRNIRLAKGAIQVLKRTATREQRRERLLAVIADFKLSISPWW